MAGTEGLFVSVVGVGVCRLYKATSSGLRLQPHSLTKRDKVHFTAHAWLAGDSSAPEMHSVGLSMASNVAIIMFLQLTLPAM